VRQPAPAAAGQHHGVAVTLSLGPLSRPQLATLLGRMSAEPLHPELVATVCTRAEGNPFFAEELLAAALRGEHELPALIEDALLADLARLHTLTCAVVRYAAVARRAVSPAVVIAAVPRSEAEVLEALREAVDHELLSPTARRAATASVTP
jgi:predicted ATPase